MLFLFMAIVNVFIEIGMFFLYVVVAPLLPFVG